jgi:hypothetical protein
VKPCDPRLLADSILQLSKFKKSDLKAMGNNGKFKKMDKFIILCNNKMNRNAARGMAIGGDVMKALDKAIPDNTAPNVCHGSMTITLFDLSTNSWVASGVFSNSFYTETSTVGGRKSLSSTLDRVRITTSLGSNAFDAGSVNIMYEG